MVTPSPPDGAVDRFDGMVRSALDDLVSLDLDPEPEQQRAQAATAGAARLTGWFRQRLSYADQLQALRQMHAGAAAGLRRMEAEERRVLARLHRRYLWQEHGWLVGVTLGVLAAAAVAFTAWQYRGPIAALIFPPPAAAPAPAPAPAPAAAGQGGAAPLTGPAAAPQGAGGSP